MEGQMNTSIPPFTYGLRKSSHSDPRNPHLHGGNHSLLSEIYECETKTNCFKLLIHTIRLPISCALFSAGRSIVIKIAIIAIMTSNSMRVKNALGT